MDVLVELYEVNVDADAPVLYHIRPSLPRKDKYHLHDLNVKSLMDTNVGFVIPHTQNLNFVW